ncbi:MAG: hypothetical protein RDU20_16825 [Desulfomonilaceae bacterium]|nr:hypothetical protein [Desulfomonilaceae bacterium]
MILRLPYFFGRDFCRTIASGLAAAILVVAFPVVSWAQEPFPKKISGIKMGDSMSAVIDMVKDSGTYESTPGTEIQRPSLTWQLPNNPYYKQMSFKFTEKDRLYLIRFDLKNITRSDLRAMKKTLFDTYGISWDDPWKLKVKGQDVLLYGPPEMGRVYYFEFFEPKTGERAYELLERVMSAEDRPVKKKDEKTRESGTDRGPKEDAVREGSEAEQGGRQASGDDETREPAGKGTLQ